MSLQMKLYQRARELMYLCVEIERGVVVLGR